MVESMVERVARAIYENVSAGVDDMESCIMAARKVVAEMREPTDAMIDAGVYADYGGTLGSRAVNCFNAMIDAALLEQQP